MYSLIMCHQKSGGEVRPEATCIAIIYSLAEDWDHSTLLENNFIVPYDT